MTEVVLQHADDKQCRRVHRRGLNGAPGLRVPAEVIRAKCAQYTRGGRPTHLAPRLPAAAFSLVTPYQAEDRGFVQYSLMAYNVHRLWRLHRVMQRSLVYTLTDNHRTSATKLSRQWKTTGATAHGTPKGLEVRQERGEGTPPLLARCGGIALRWRRKASRNAHLKEGFGTRREVVQRLLAQACALCGSTGDGEVHHICQLAALPKPGSRRSPAGANGWPHAAGRPGEPAGSATRGGSGNAPQSTTLTAQITGEPREIERLTRGSEGGCWKSTQRGNSLAAYPTTRPVLNGGREETCRKVTRLVPTQHHHTGKVLAYVFGRRQDTVFVELQALLEPFGIMRYFTDGWGAYERHLDAAQHQVGKAHTQKIESKHINLRTRIKRLVRRTICFSKTERMHDLVIGLFINRYEFGVAV